MMFRLGASRAAFCCALTILLAPSVALTEQGPATIGIDRTLDVLHKPSSRNPGRRALLLQAGEKLGDWEIMLGGRSIRGADLVTLAQTPIREPLARAVREYLRRPVDVDDFLLFLDDLLARGEQYRDRTVYLPGGRARAAGILLHPDDVFRKRRPRMYGVRISKLSLDKPKRPTNLEPASDGDPLGPSWSARFANPEHQEARMAALASANPSGTFHERLQLLISQLREQGADVFIDSTLRHRERGYLMWGAFVLSRAKSEAKVERTIGMLDQVNRDWHLNVPITWRHPSGWEATVEAARQMADAYDVVFATRRGAMNSDHYDGVAIDFTAVGLPREVTLVAPDGASRTFDLSDARQSRDLSLTREMIAWVEDHFGLRKLLRDYPHWTDAVEPAQQEAEPATELAGDTHRPEVRRMR